MDVLELTLNEFPPAITVINNILTMQTVVGEEYYNLSTLTEMKYKKLLEIQNSLIPLYNESLKGD